MGIVQLSGDGIAMVFVEDDDEVGSHQCLAGHVGGGAFEFITHLSGHFCHGGVAWIPAPVQCAQREDFHSFDACFLQE